MDLLVTKEDQSSSGQISDAHTKDEEGLVDAATQALITGSADQCAMGVQLISQLTAEINQVSKSIEEKPFAKGRKALRQFRNTRLFSIFQLSCTLLRTALVNAQTLIFNDESLHALMTQLFQLAKRCLTFDSQETASDESIDEMILITVPTSWRLVFLDSSTVQLFFDLYSSLPATLSPMALSCLVQLASVRQDIFSIDEERVRFLSQLTNGVRNVLQNPQGLDHSSNYHQFCRLVLQLKMNYQIDELVSVECYPEVIQLIAHFTKESAHKRQSSHKSICCLLSFWEQMVDYSYLMQSKKPHLLEMHTHDIVQAYILSYLESESVVLCDGLEDPLNDVSAIQQQLQMIFTIGRYGYSRTYELLVQVFEQTAQRYQEVITAHVNLELQQHSKDDIAVLEGQLAWLVYMITSAIGRQSHSPSSHDADAMDGDLVCRVLQLMNVTDSCLPGRGCEKWELALIAFFEQLWRIHRGKTSVFYERFSQILGPNDESKILAVFIQKITMNLKHWGHSEQVLANTLRLMLDLTKSHFCERKLAGLDGVQSMMNNHTSEQFPFLAPGMPVQMMRHRTPFYTCLGQILLVDLGEDEEKFTRFMIPISTALDNVKQLLAEAETPVFQVDEAKKELIGLARDLRGLAQALDTAISFMMLFYWIYPRCTGVMIRGVEIWCHDPELTTPVLKLFAELVSYSSRLQFHSSSANGIVLLQEASKILSAYGSGVRAKDHSIPKEQIYPLRLKGINICCSILLNALFQERKFEGCQFGVDAVTTALHTFPNLLPSMPLTHLQMNQRLSSDYYRVLEHVVQEHRNILIAQEPNVLLYVLYSLAEGIFIRRIHICNSSCKALALLLTHLYECRHHESKRDTVNLENDNLVRAVQEQPSILHQLLATVLNNCISQRYGLYSRYSNILLPLILLNKEHFVQLRQPTISRCAADRQAAAAQWLDGLMEGVEPNLLSANRDKFHENMGRGVR